eukprot:s5093_g6.t3
MLKQKMKRELRALARGRRREALLQALDLTEQAYQAGDIRKHYQLIRRIAPRSYRRKICLRSEEGVMLSNEEECLALAKYAQKLFSGVTVDVPELIALPQEWFTASGWKCALTKLQNHKAVPKHAASIVSWKSHADHLAPALQQLADDTICKSEPSVPEMWTRVQLAWLPKPGRAPNSPEVLRSIGLMGPDTKAFLMILKRNANPWVQQALRKYPQYAYRGLASTNDALLRATLHCSTVRHRMEGYAEDHTAKILGQAKRELIGGLMVGLDLSKAFDLLSHQEMLLSLRDSGMPEGLCRILLHIHVQTQLTIEHAGCSRTIRMSRGLRQGCCVAPMIYACWTIRLCKLLDARMQSAYPVQTHEQGTQDAEGTWTQNHMSLFAGDKHCHWDIRSYSDLTVALHQLTLVIETITELGMRINFQKCLATVALKGFRQLRASKSIFRQWNGVKCLMLRHDHHNIYIPTAEQMPYLGAILSYGNFELATAKHRAAQATANFGQLRSVLRTNGPLSQARRLSVYKLCVWDTNGTKDEDGSLAKEVENLRECVFALQKLTLRHEDVLSSLKAELSWALFLRVDMKASVVKPLYAMQQEWRDLKKKSPNQLQGPMCVSLVRTLFKEFGKRIEMLPQQTEQLKIVRNLGWMEPEALVWRYVQWGPAAERLKPQIDREGVPLEKVAALIASIQELVAKEGAVRRFHPNRKLEATMGGHNLTFGLQMSICGEASKSIREHLAILSGLAATQLIGMGLRPERPGRSHLANQIQRQIRK